MLGSSVAGQKELVHQNATGQSAWHLRHARWPKLDLRRWQCAGLLGALTLLQLTVGAVVPLDAAIGPSVALLTLLAVWAVFGRERIALRLPMSLWLVVASYLALLYGEWRANGLDGEFLYLGAWLLAFGVMQLPLWLLRAIGGWRLEVMPAGDAAMGSSVSLDRRTIKAVTQFSTRDLLGWMMGAAILLAVLRKLMADVAFDMGEVVAELPDIGLMSLMLASAGLPVIVLAWMILVAGRRLLLRSLLTALLIITFPVGILLFVHLSELSTESDIACLEGAALANGMACLIVIACCGYRLERPPRAADRAPHGTHGVAACSPLSRRGFALAAAALLVIAGTVACAAPERLEEWRRSDVRAEWRERGFEVRFNEDGTLDIGSHIHGAPVSDDTLQRIACIDSRGHFSLDGAKISDTQLAILAPMVRLRELWLDDCELSDLGLSRLPTLGALETLNLMNTPITNAGLAGLITLPNLQSVWLDGSEVTDEGLLILARLPKLSRLTVSFTAVTETGAKRFAAARPDVDVVFGACDRDLGRWLMILGHWTELYQGIGPCRRNPTVAVKRLHLRGTMRDPDSGAVLRVTDAALAALADLDELEELDLRDTDITDRGLQPLAKHAALKRLDLRGTKVSEQAVAALSGSLPTCMIIAPSDHDSRSNPK